MMRLALQNKDHGKPGLALSGKAGPGLAWTGKPGQGLDLPGLAILAQPRQTRPGQAWPGKGQAWSRAGPALVCFNYFARPT